MHIAWTTVGSREEADRLASAVVELNLAACVQVDGPIRSHYQWQGRVECGEEWRLWLKCLPEALPALERYVLAHHPYDTPQWIVVSADHVGEKYLSWARANSTTPPL